MSSFASLSGRAVDWLAIATFTGMFACVLAGVVFRYFLGDPLVWSDELARYLFIWCSLLGWVIAARKRSHLSVSIIADGLRPKVARCLGWSARPRRSPSQRCSFTTG